MKKTLYCLLLSLCVAGCSESPEEQPDSATSTGAADVTAEVEAFYAANPDFFSFKTPADLQPGS